METSFTEYIQPKINTLRFATGLLDTKIATTLDTLDQIVIHYYLPDRLKKAIPDGDFIIVALPTLNKLYASDASLISGDMYEMERMKKLTITRLFDYMDLLLKEINLYKGLQ